MKKTISLYLLWIFFQLAQCVTAYANDSTKTWKEVLTYFRKNELALKAIKPKLQKSIREVTVLDLREDVERIGMYNNFFEAPTQLFLSEKATLNGLFSSTLADENVAGSNIVLAVRHFWLSEIQKKYHIDRMDRPSRSDITVRQSKITCTIEAYIKHDQYYYPLVRVDTVIWDKLKVYEAAVSLIEETIEILHNKISVAANEGKYLKRKKFDIEAIHHSYDNRFEFPIFKSNVLKGVFATAEDFKNNRPYSSDFSITVRNGEPPVLYVKDEKGNEFLTRKAFAVSDGKNTYIMQDGMLFKLFKEGTAFYWMGIKALDLKQRGIPIIIPVPGGFIYGADPVSAYVKVRLTPCLLNFDTGEEY